ncbi:MAG: hypothetical protein AAF902_03055, partial [Chloroflexota bacterium]
VMRSYVVEQRFDRSEVRIERIQDDRLRNVFDGAGVISREMLDKFVLRPELSPIQQKKIADEMAHAGRIEFTIMTELGQEKGHAIVADGPLLGSDGKEIDFLVPEDIKGEVKLTDSDVAWVGINFVHGKGSMKMDIQSAVNLGPTAQSDQAFLSPKQYADFMRDERSKFEQAVLAGEDPTLHLDEFSTPEQIAQSPNKEFAAAGGDIRQYETHISRVIDQKIESMEFERSQQHKNRRLSLPVPGARLYVMPDVVAAAAGITMAIPRGQVHMDLERGTAWVNSEDWLQLQDSPTMGLRDIWGGADNDDALWMIPFMDQAAGARGEFKVLAWRSPNEDGEYMVLRTTANSDLPKWRKANGEVIYGVEANSDYLPTRVDHANRTYQGLVSEPTGGEKVVGFDMKDMRAAAKRGAANAGALGLYINPSIVYRSAHGELPDDLPASTEDVIDAMNKNGGDLTAVKNYSYQLSERMATSGVPIPRYLADRLIFDPELSRDERNALDLSVRYTDGTHFVDQLTGAMRQEIDALHKLKREMVSGAHAPNELYDSVFEQPNGQRYLDLGGDLNRTFGKVLKSIKQERIQELKRAKFGDRADTVSAEQIKGVKLSRREINGIEFTPQDFDKAKWAVWEKLNHFDSTEQGKILRAALVHDLMSGKGGKSMWRYAVKDPLQVIEGMPHVQAYANRQTGLGNAMNRALQEVELLHYLPNDQPLTRPTVISPENNYRPITLSGVEQNVLPGVSPTLHIWKGEDGLFAQTGDGKFFGHVARGDFKAGDRVMLKYSYAEGRGQKLFGVIENNEDEFTA